MKAAAAAAQIHVAQPAGAVRQGIASQSSKTVKRAKLEEKKHAQNTTTQSINSGQTQARVLSLCTFCKMTGHRNAFRNGAFVCPARRAAFKKQD